MCVKFAPIDGFLFTDYISSKCLVVMIFKLYLILCQDFGIWERGDKTNQGISELNASSVGMAKVHYISYFYQV